MSDSKIFDFEGIVYRIGDEWSNDSKTFFKRSLILLQVSDYNGKKYENYIEFDLINEGMHLLAPVNEGNKVNVRFVLNGRLGKEKYEGRAFTTLKAINIEILEASTPQQVQTSIKADEVHTAVENFVADKQPVPLGSDDNSDGTNDLPF